MARPRWIFAATFTICLVSLIRAQLYFGTIYRGWDAQFYYSLAASLVLDGDADLTDDLLRTPYPQPFDRDADGVWEAAPRRPDGRIPSKYPIGMSLLEAPLLAFGHLARRLAGAVGVRVSAPAGYSAVEIWFVAVGLLAWFAAGLTALYRLLAANGNRVGAAVGVVGCWMGTSLYYYSSVYPFMTHAVSFVLLVAVMGLTAELVNGGPVNRLLALLGVCLAGLFLVRPQQAIVLLFLLPLLLQMVRDRPRADWITGAAVAVAAGFIALAVHAGAAYLQFGTFTSSGYSAGGEGFDWLHPDLPIVLLSASRGLLVYSPIFALAAVGYAARAHSIPVWAWPMVVNAVAQVYIVAAWSSPHQGDSFGSRMLADNAAVVAVGLAVLFDRAPARWCVAIAVATVLAVSWTTYLLARYVGLFGWTPLGSAP